jgi:hypothetical protein
MVSQEKSEPAVNMSSYRRFFPDWEPEVFNLTTVQGEDLEEITGERLVRGRKDARFPLGEPIKVVGLNYTSFRHADLAQIVDDVTAPMGGFEEFGPPFMRVGRSHSRAPYVVHCVVKLPKAVLQAMSTGVKVCGAHNQGGAIVLRSSHDGSYAVSLSVTAFGTLIPGAMLESKRRHTAGVVFLPETIKGYADKIPEMIEKFAQGLRNFSGMVLGRLEVEEIVKKVAGGQERAADAMMNLILGANDTNVSRSPEPGVFRGIQIFEAATAYDRFHRRVRAGVKGEHTDEGAVRLNRLLDGKTMGSAAYAVLTAAFGEMEAAQVAPQ